MSDTVEEDILIVLNDNLSLASLLEEWDLLLLFPKLNDAGIDIDALSGITERDLDQIFPEFKEIGLKIKLRKQIVEWRKSNGIIEDTESVNLTMPSEWGAIRSVASPTPSTSSSLGVPENNDDYKNEINQMFNQPHIKDVLKSISLGGRNSTREFLCNKIVANLLENKIFNLSATGFHFIVNQISKYCPSEKPEYYFQDGKFKKGKLYYKYRNNKTVLRQIGILGSRHPKKNNVASEGNEFVKDEICDDLDSDGSKNWLLFHNEPWETVESHWTITAPSRLKYFQQSKNKNITEFLNEWPLLKSAKGHRLIDIDFAQIYPDKSLNLFTKWTNNFSQKLFSLIVTDVKDRTVQEAGNKIKDIIMGEEFLKDGIHLHRKNFVIAELFKQLNGLLVPTSRKKSVKNNNIWKPSIIESFDSFIHYIVDVAEIKKTLDNKKKKYAEFGLTLQPSLFALNDVNKNVISKIYIYYDDIFYLFDNIMNAIDINFKIFYVMNLKYPFECFKIYKFLEYLMYDLSSNNEIPFEIKNLKELLE